MNKAAFITGASGGIGQAIALRLADDGFDIAACRYSDEKGAKALEDALKEKNVKFQIIKANVGSFEEISREFKKASDYFGGFSVLVNCAGVALEKMLVDTTDEEFDALVSVNFKGVFNTCKCAVPFMVSQKEGSIINISSMWGVYGASCESLYSATKSAVIGLSEGLARELAPSNVRVNCIAPGAIDTKMNNNLSECEKLAFAEEIPMGRFGLPEEIAGAVSFLASDDSKYMTAQTLVVDGGLV